MYHTLLTWGNQYHYYFLSVSHGLTASMCYKAKEKRLFCKIHKTWQNSIHVDSVDSEYYWLLSHTMVILKISGLSNMKEFSRGSVVIVAPWSPLQYTKLFSSEKEKWLYYVAGLPWGESWSSIFDNYSFVWNEKKYPSQKKNLTIYSHNIQK